LQNWKNISLALLVAVVDRRRDNFLKPEAHGRTIKPGYKVMPTYSWVGCVLHKVFQLKGQVGNES
jgi:hypothetical protein